MLREIRLRLSRPKTGELCKLPCFPFVAQTTKVSAQRLLDLLNLINTNAFSSGVAFVARPFVKKSSGVKWTPEEDQILRQAVEQHGAKNWKMIGASSPPFPTHYVVYP